MVLIIMDCTLILISRRRWYIILFSLFGTLCGFIIESLGVNLNLWSYGQEIAILGVPPVIYVGWFFTMLLTGIITFFILNYIVDKKPINDIKDNFFKIIITNRIKFIIITTLITWPIGCGIEIYGVNQNIWNYIELGLEILNVPIIVLLAWGIVMFFCILLFYIIIDFKEYKLKSKRVA